MGDTIVKWFSDLTIWIGSLTVLPGESGFRSSVRGHVDDMTNWIRENLTGPGILDFGPKSTTHEKRVNRTEYENKM